MKNVAMTVLMLLFVGVGTSMAQSKTEISDQDAAVTTEVKAVEKHSCQGSAAKACCAGKKSNKKTCTAAEKKACSHTAKLNNGRSEDAAPAPKE